MREICLQSKEWETCFDGVGWVGCQVRPTINALLVEKDEVETCPRRVRKRKAHFRGNTVWLQRGFCDSSIWRFVI